VRRGTDEDQFVAAGAALAAGRSAMKFDAALMPVDIATSAAQAERLEALGYDGILSFEGPHDPFLPLALAAAATRRVELMTAIAIAFARNPMICAYTANDLHVISGGRFILGLGSQIRPHIERRFGQTWSRPNARMREFVLAVRAIWEAWNRGGRLDFRGEFYTHTLMTPFFDPGPNPHGPPPVFLAGFGPSMVRVAGEVADGWFVHPLHSDVFVREVALPALEQGLATSGRSRGDIRIAAQTITMIGGNDEQIARAREQAKAQIAFYGSTPAYKVLLDHHGWGDLQPRLNRMSKEGRWGEMTALVSDEMLDTIGVSGTHAAAGARLRQRNQFADRTNLVLYNEAEPDAVLDLLRAARAS
jgi:probable F420-dependent oxidoreductase